MKKKSVALKILVGAIASILLIGSSNSTALAANATAAFTGSDTNTVTSKCNGEYRVFSWTSIDYDACYTKHVSILGGEHNIELVDDYGPWSKSYVDVKLEDGTWWHAQKDQPFSCDCATRGGPGGSCRTREFYYRCYICHHNTSGGTGDSEDHSGSYVGVTGTDCTLSPTGVHNYGHRRNSLGQEVCYWCGAAKPTPLFGDCKCYHSQSVTVNWKTYANYVNSDGAASHKDFSGRDKQNIIVQYNSLAELVVESTSTKGNIVGYRVVVNGVESGLIGGSGSTSTYSYNPAYVISHVNDYTSVQFHIYLQTGRDYYLPVIEVIPGVIFNYHDNNTSSIDYNGSNTTTSGSVPMTIVKYGSYNYVATNNYKIATYNKNTHTNFRADDKVRIREHSSDNGLPAWNTKPDGSGHTFLEGQYVSYDWLVSNFGYVIDVYAQWERYAIFNFNPNGGTAVNTTKKVFTGDPMGDMPTTSRSGYHFDGWYTAKDGGTLVTKDTISSWTSNTGTSSPNVTLYAHWTKDSGTSVTGQPIDYYEDTTFNVLQTGYYLLEAFGGQGASLNNYGSTYLKGGEGGEARAFVFLEKGQTVYIKVGKAEDTSHGGGTAKALTIAKTKTSEVVNGQTVNQNTTVYTKIYVGNGGGSSDFRIGGNGLDNRIVVAGGGGATGLNSTGLASVSGTTQRVGLTTTSTATNANTGVITTSTKNNGTGSLNSTKYYGTSNTPSGGGGGYMGGNASTYSFGSAGSNYIADKSPTLTEGSQWTIKPEYNTLSSGYNNNGNGYCRIIPYYTINLDANSPTTGNGYEVYSSNPAYVDNYDTYIDATALPQSVKNRLNQHNSIYNNSRGNYVNPLFGVVLVSTEGNYPLNKFQQLPIASLKGWNFQGWRKTAANSDNAEVKDTDSLYDYVKGSALVSDKWLYGHWVEQEYYIEYNANNTYNNRYGDLISTKNHYPFGVSNGKVAKSQDAFYDTNLVDKSKLGGTYYDGLDHTVVKLDGDNLTYNSATDTYTQKVKYDHYIQFLPNYFTKIGYNFVNWTNQADTNMYYDSTGKGVGSGTGKQVTDKSQYKYWDVSSYDALDIGVVTTNIKATHVSGHYKTVGTESRLYNYQNVTKQLDLRQGQTFTSVEGNFNYIVNAKQIYASQHNKTEAIANMKRIYSGFTTSTTPRWIYSLANASDNNRKYYYNTTKLNSAGSDYVTNTNSSDGGYNQKGGYSETYQCYANQIQFATVTKTGQQNVQLYACWEPIKYKLEFNGVDNWNTSVSNYYQEVPMINTNTNASNGTGTTIRYDQVFTLATNKFSRNVSDGKTIKIDKSISMKDAIEKYYLFDLDVNSAEDQALWNSLVDGTEIPIKESYTWLAWGLGTPYNLYTAGETYSDSNWKLQEVNTRANVKQLWNWSTGADSNNIVVWKNQTLYGADYIDNKTVKNVLSDEAIQTITKYITDINKKLPQLSTSNGQSDYYMPHGTYEELIETPIESNLYSIWYNGKQGKLTVQNPSPDGGTYEPVTPTPPTEGPQVVPTSGPDGSDDNNGYSTTITFNFNGGQKYTDDSLATSIGQYRMTMNKANVYFAKFYINGKVNQYNDKTIKSNFDSFGKFSTTDKSKNFDSKTGLNVKAFFKNDANANALRFCGWNTDKGSITPNISLVDTKLIQSSKVNMDEFDYNNSNNAMLVANDLTLYAVWEPVPRLQLTLNDITTATNTISNISRSNGYYTTYNKGILYDVSRGDRLQYGILNSGANRGTVPNASGKYEETVAKVTVRMDPAVKEIYELGGQLTDDGLNYIVTQDEAETAKNKDEVLNEGLSTKHALDRNICGNYNSQISESNGNNNVRYSVGEGTSDNVIRYLDNRILRTFSVPLDLGTDKAVGYGYTSRKAAYDVSVHMEVPTNFARLRSNGIESVDNVIQFSLYGASDTPEPNPGPDDKDKDTTDINNPDAKTGDIKTTIDK